jgi:hypothetical protein
MIHTVKLSKFKRSPNRTELNTSSPRQIALEFLNYFCVFLQKVEFGWLVQLIGSVRSNRTELLTKKAQK